MGRGKVEVKRIEDKSNRQVTFSKRRTGLMKKARELSVLCDVDVAVHIFSGRGRLYEFASGESLRKIYERFEGQRSTAEAGSKSAHDPREAKLKLGAEYRDMWTISDHLEMIQRQLEGQKVEQLNMAELTRIELQLDALLQQTRIKKEEKHQREANEATEEQITTAEINDQYHQTPAPPPMQLPPGPSTSITNQ